MILRLITMLPAAALAVALSQAPEFAQQYRQRLGGALDEVTRVVERFAEDARRASLTTDQAVRQLQANGDRLARDRGTAAAEDIERKARLERQKLAFETRGPFGRLTALATDFDPALTQRTWASFEPAMPITTEGLVGAALGFVGGLAFTEALVMWWRRSRQRRADAKLQAEIERGKTVRR
jgi:hypothetical protein